MSATFKDVLKKVLDSQSATMYSVNKNMMEIRKSNKKKPGFVKVAIEDDTALQLMGRKAVGFIIFIDGDEMNGIAESLDKEA